MELYRQYDGILLEAFAARKDEAAFAELVRRHGPAVLGVCRRVCGNLPEAEDAAQAVFLALAKKAHVLRQHENLAAWLHCVAVCVARDARRAALARKRREEEAARMTRITAEEEPESWRELLPLLDEAIEDLPETYRSAVILHHLEGHTHEAAAAKLGCKPSALSMRLTRGRELLRENLARRGAVVTLAALAACLAGQVGDASAAELPAAFAATTAHAAAGGAVSTSSAQLTQGAMKMLFVKKLQVAAAWSLAALLAVSITAGVALNARATEAGTPKPAPAIIPAGEPVKAPAAAEAPVAKPRSFSGAATKLDDAVKTLGRKGCLVVRSQARWEQLQKELAALGWAKPEKDPFGGVDFSKETVIGVFEYGDVGDTLALHEGAGDAKACDLKFVLGYIIYKKRGAEEFGWHFIFTAIPSAETIKVSLGRYHPQNGGPNPTPDKAAPEWEWSTDASRGDAVDGLSAVIKPDAVKISAGADIQIEFKLEYHAIEAAAKMQLAGPVRSAFVWDGKYSNGYRNHAFLVETPNGKTQYLRRPVQNEWLKNMPHPVEVAPGKPYVLPGWRFDNTLKSLKELGLDTSAPGIYRITGLYMENASTAKDWANNNKEVAIWGGNIASSTVSVEVIK